MARKRTKTLAHYESRPPPLKQHPIEEQTGRWLSMRTETHSASTRINVNAQRASRFFALPPEVRLRIYESVFAENPDPTALYRSSAPYFRPGHERLPRTDTTLLLTCRRIWLEANHLPLKLATHRFWFFNGPLDLARLKQSARTLAATQPFGGIVMDESDAEENRIPLENERYREFFERLTPLDRTQLGHVQIFAFTALAL